jgi:hypothetical protein
MILNHNIVVNNQCFFSGEFVPDNSPKGITQERMTWLHEHQVVLRLACEIGGETPHYRHDPVVPSDDLGKTGDILPCDQVVQISPLPV